MSVTGSVRVHAKEGNSGQARNTKQERERERERKRENGTSCGWFAASGSVGGSPTQRQGDRMHRWCTAIKSSNCFAKRM